jgi:ABC-type dipeptide/oligopeptide/nickel transport system ATPase component
MLPACLRWSSVTSPVLTADISADYRQKPGVLRGAKLDVSVGEILGLVGQSGSGKSTLAMALLGLLNRTGATVRGNAFLVGQNLIGATERQMRDIRGRVVSLIPQSPMAALNPVLRIGTQLREAWVAHSKSPWRDQLGVVKGLLVQAGLPGDEAFLRRFPNQISVGQAQRVLIVMALLHAPALLIADEPTSALDMITQRDICELIRKIAGNRGMGVLFISHDLLSVASICHRVAILHQGSVVECASVADIITAPQHPYTRELVAAIPKWPLG